MVPSEPVRILSSWCATSLEAAESVFSALVAAVPREQDAAWRELLDRLNAVRLLRMLTRVRAFGGPLALDLNDLSMDGDRVLWRGEPIGNVHVLYKVALPEEAQARVAHEIFFYRFIAFLGIDCHAVALHESDWDVRLFVPAPATLDLPDAWRRFVVGAFSTSQLERTFAPLVNAIKLANRGFSALDVPIVSEDQAAFLAAFYLANVQSLQRGDERRRREIDKLRQQLDNAQSRERARIEKRIAKIEAELSTHLDRYGLAYEEVDRLAREKPAWMARVRSLAQSAFTPLAGTQIAKVGNKVAKCVAHMRELAGMQGGDLYQLPPLLAISPPSANARPGGDDSQRICYGCGRELPKGEKRYKANKFIFESPSQRLQSSSSETRPKVCASCAAVSFVSPIKLGSGRLVIRMRDRRTRGRLLADEQLRMLVMGEMNIVAGTYALLQAHETANKKAVSDALGGLQYALYKVASSFEPEVFERYEIEALVGDALLTLPGRHLAWLHDLITVFDLARQTWHDKGLFAAFGRAIRHVQHEEVIFAVYELLSSGIIGLPLSQVRSSQLEQLRAEHVRWLEMEHKAERAQLFRDVAAMTGLLYAFCDYVRSTTRGTPAERIEVRKVIERADDPYQVNYTVAGNTASEMATLYRNSDMHFCYDQTKALLRELGVDVAEREVTQDNGRLTLRLFFDDVVQAYTHLFETRYSSTKDQRDLVYELKLSLHARFAELIAPEKKE